MQSRNCEMFPKGFALAQDSWTYFRGCRITLLTNPPIASLFGRLFQGRVQTAKMIAKPALITPA